MKHIKSFVDLLNEASDSGLDKLLDTAYQMIDKGKIYGLKIPSYPFVLALTGAGYDDHCDGAWLIKDKEDFHRWVSTVNTNSTTFPDLSGKNKRSTGSYKETLQNLKYPAFDNEDWGSVVNFYKDEASLKKAIENSESMELDDEDLYGPIMNDGFITDRKLKKNW